ncbi:MAG: EAL domain-containing protein [Sulfuriflexus sp.]|nr:EAL domain-containing protein [Sulfuriflexus sp.]
MPKAVRILIVEDSENDAELLLRELRKGGFAPEHTRVDTDKAMRAALAKESWDIIVSDYSMPHFDGISALNVMKQHSKDIPFIIVSANIGEEIAVMAMKAGAHDYIMKGNLARLIPAIEREIKEAKLRQKHRFAENEMHKLTGAIEQTSDAVMICNAQGIIEYVNSGFVRMTGYSKDEALGNSSRMLKSGRQDDSFFGVMWDTISLGDVFQDVFINKRKDGSLYYEEKSITPLKNDRGVVEHYISTGKDITEQMQTRERLHHLSQHDLLTGLPNRLLFNDRLEQAIPRARRSGRVLAILLIDMDRFKNINETLGFDCGDHMLQAVGERLLTSTRDGDTVARLGDDEFAIILEDVKHQDDVSKIVEKILRALSEAYYIDDHELFITTSIGISLYPNDGAHPQLLIQNADVAIHHAKESGSNKYRYYETKMNAQSLYRLNLESSLRKALEREEFFLLYQPQIDLVTHEITGFEALLRWAHPELGTVSPVEFIPLLEETGMIKDVGRWILRKACQTCKSWHNKDLGNVSIAVNLSPVQFEGSQISDIVSNILKETELTANYLELELTESTIMRNPENAAITLTKLSGMGITLAIDDFGTGYSSLSYLQKFPLDTLKIDRSFVNDITENKGDASIVSAIISMAHSLGLTVVAEGVETTEQLTLLQEKKCESVQGFLFSKPITEIEVEEMLKEWSKQSVFLDLVSSN